MNRRSFLRSALVAFASTTALARVAIALEHRKVVLDAGNMAKLADASRALLASSDISQKIREDLARAYAERVDEIFLDGLYSSAATIEI